MTEAARYFVGGLRVIRCYAAPSENKGEALHWSIIGIPVEHEDAGDVPAVGTRRDLVFVGELLAHTNYESVAVTAEAQISYTDQAPSGLVEDPAVGLAEVQRIGVSVQHLLYDLAANAGRTVAALTQLSVSIPQVTPDGEIRLVDMYTRENDPPEDGDE